jgi:hypothetical protein
MTRSVRSVLISAQSPLDGAIGRVEKDWLQANVIDFPPLRAPDGPHMMAANAGHLWSRIERPHPQLQSTCLRCSSLQAIGSSGLKEESHVRRDELVRAVCGHTASILYRGQFLCSNSAAMRTVVTTSACLQQVNDAFEPKNRS